MACSLSPNRSSPELQWGKTAILVLIDTFNAPREMLFQTLESLEEVQAMFVYEDPHCRLWLFANQLVPVTDSFLCHVGWNNGRTEKKRKLKKPTSLPLSIFQRDPTWYMMSEHMASSLSLSRICVAIWNMVESRWLKILSTLLTNLVRTPKPQAAGSARTLVKIGASYFIGQIDEEELLHSSVSRSDGRVTTASKLHTATVR